MKWLINLLTKTFNRYSARPDIGLMPVSIERKMISSPNTLSVEIIKAENGFVLTFRSYDRKTDRHNDRNFIIADNEALDVRVAEIITTQMLRM